MDDHHINTEPDNQNDEQNNQSSSQLEVAFEISRLLNTGLDKETLSLCMGLLEQGVNPEALADVIIEIREQDQRDQRDQRTQQEAHNVDADDLKQGS